jgi:putative oxidoreductase
MATTIDPPSRTMTIVLWVLRLLMAALFLFAAFAKLTSQPQMVEGFALLPVGQWFRYLVGLMELVGGVAVLVPSVSGLGALLLQVVDVGRSSPKSCSCTRTGFTPSSSGPFSSR